MSTNKNAVLRYNTLDKCFSNPGRQYYFDDLLEAVNKALLSENTDSSGIQTRQLREDIRFMKSEQGYFAPIESIRVGKKAYYRYEDSGFSINQTPLNKTEAEQLRNAISVLQRFEGSPEFEWVNELVPLLKDQFGLKDNATKVMGFDSNIEYSGYEYITPLFNAIVNQRVLKIDYRPFGKEKQTLNFHPHYLKQFNNRWFVFGRNEHLEIKTWNLAIDRIETLGELDSKYVENSIDWEDFFDDMIGVTKLSESKVEKVELLFTKEQAPYVLTKPLHHSQKIKILDNESLKVTLELIVNYELEMKILSFAERVMVLTPLSLAKIVSNRLKLGSELY
jgi:predicted DNA-binding transcriptional regulator YafY